MKSTLLALLTLIGTTLAAQVQSVKLTGTITGLKADTVRLLDADFSEIKTTVTKDGKFSITADLETGDMRFYILHVPSLGGLGPSMSRPFTHILICSNNIDFTGHVAEKHLIADALKGAPCKAEFDNILDNLNAAAIIEKIAKEYNEAFNAYNHVDKSEENKARLTETSNKLDKAYKMQRQEILDLVKQQPNNMVLATLATQYAPVSDEPEEMEAYLAQFSDEVSHNYYLQKIKNTLNKLSALDMGKIAPDFSLLTPEKKSVSLSDFKGKYVLLDFWASWCGPCRKENPNVLAAYDKFKAKNFDVFAVSIDQNHDKWLKAIEEDQMPFTHVIDTQDRANAVGSLYQIKAIPTNYLLDPTGKIIAKNLRGEDLHTFLAENLK